MQRSTSPLLTVNYDLDVECRLHYQMVGALGGGGVGPSVQSESQRAALIKRYPADRLYTVVDNVSAQSTLDLSLAAGTLVALIKDGDPMGNKERWFVDSGG